jgi:hypothetical protein
MFSEFDTIKHIKNFPNYGVWYGRTYYVIFQKKVRYGTVWYLVRQQFERITVELIYTLWLFSFEIFQK